MGKGKFNVWSILHVYETCASLCVSLESIWGGKFPCKVAFFVWTAALNFIMAVNSLVKRKIVVLIDM